MASKRKSRHVVDHTLEVLKKIQQGIGALVKGQAETNSRLLVLEEKADVTNAQLEAIDDHLETLDRVDEHRFASIEARVVLVERRLDAAGK